jgi:hypothetical protein
LRKPCGKAIKLGMAFAKRWYSKGRIDKAGKDLITLTPDDPGMNETLEVINNWRACHGFVNAVQQEIELGPFKK